MGISEGERDIVWLLTSLGDIGVASCVEIVLEGKECEICIRSVLGEDWLYWGVLGSRFSLVLDGGFVCAVPGVL